MAASPHLGTNRENDSPETVCSESERGSQEESWPIPQVPQAGDKWEMKHPGSRSTGRGDARSQEYFTAEAQSTPRGRGRFTAGICGNHGDGASRGAPANPMRRPDGQMAPVRGVRYAFVVNFSGGVDAPEALP